MSDKSFLHKADAASLGLEMGLCVTFGYLGGVWLDEQLGSEPWAMLALLLCGIAAGFRAVLRISRKHLRMSRAEARE